MTHDLIGKYPLKLLKARTVLNGLNSILFRGGILWNSLPDEMKFIPKAFSSFFNFHFYLLLLDLIFVTHLSPACFFSLALRLLLYVHFFTFTSLCLLLNVYFGFLHSTFYQRVNISYWVKNQIKSWPGEACHCRLCQTFIPNVGFVWF